MLGSITRASASRGYDLLISFQQASEDWHADFEDANRADGIIFLGYGDYVTYVQKLVQLTDVGAHFITWGPVLDGQPGVSIGCDNFHASYTATRHLLSLGRKRIAFLGGISEHSPEFSQRYAGYVAALKEADIAIDPALQVNAETSEDAGYKAALVLLQRRIAVDGVFGASDLIAIGAMKAFQEAGVAIPAELSIIGFDDIPMASYTHPPLTTIQQNTRAAGELLVENLLKLVAGETVESFLLPATLVVRGSCGGQA